MLKTIDLFGWEGKGKGIFRDNFSILSEMWVSKEPWSSPPISCSRTLFCPFLNLTGIIGSVLRHAKIKIMNCKPLKRKWLAGSWSFRESWNFGESLERKRFGYQSHENSYSGSECRAGAQRVRDSDSCGHCSPKETEGRQWGSDESRGWVKLFKA